MRLLAIRQAVLRLRGPGLALSVVERPLVERHEALPRLLDELLAELDGLGQDDLFLGGQQGDLADLLEVHPDRVVDADHVGTDGLEVLGGRLLDLLGVELGRPFGRQARRGIDRPVLGHDLHAHDAVFLGLADRPEVEILVVIVVVIVRGDRHGGPGSRRPKAG